jgi:hypothetical protein
MCTFVLIVLAMKVFWRIFFERHFELALQEEQQLFKLLQPLVSNFTISLDNQLLHGTELTEDLKASIQWHGLKLNYFHSSSWRLASIRHPSRRFIGGHGVYKGLVDCRQ